MVITFNVVNWVMVTLTFIASFSAWIYLLVEKDNIVSNCIAASPSGPTVSQNGTAIINPATVNGTIAINKNDNSTLSSLVFVDSNASACQGDVQKVIVWMGVSVFIGNMLSIYFASAVGAYAARLKRNINGHQKLRDMDARSGHRPVVPAGY
ncbi:hypothetical protein BC936DRAFT_149124 [Jimgerdemannia flammicorona]|uniref:Uncharacterized protein n=1 Tax=Jimgerdemannia flammicorona TaxID=994334 RepID=A0A433D1I7_9FUNG|nr:hypothetical protein BC936DRAFT_149124 [Jimgerdemannia flammicorona]